MLAVHFSDSITLGAALVAMVGVLIGLYRVALGAKLRATNEIQGREIVAKDSEIERLDREAAHKEQRLNELGAEKDAALVRASACEATVETLTEQLKQMPRYDDVIRLFREQIKDLIQLFGEQMNHADTVASDRTKSAVEAIAGSMDRNELRAQQRHEATLKVLSAIEHKLTKEPT